MTEKQEKPTQAVAQPEVFTFNPANAPIRVQVINQEPWFVAKDVCDALTLENSRKATASLDDDEKGVSPIVTPSGTQQMTIVNESGLYNLIFQSRKPEAKAFRKWVTSEVLPAIRRTGRYELKKSAPAKTHNYPRRGELITADLVNLLWLIGESLEHGDQAQIALELGVSRNTVSGTLNGKIRSSRVLRALYRKAMQRREEFMLYHRPDKMAERLIGGDRSSLPTQLPTVHIAGCKGLLVCQNARKNHKKGGAL